jgi:hypothetical protein
MVYCHQALRLSLQLDQLWGEDPNVGPNEQTRFILNIQPVMPFALNKNWNLIARVILPLVSQPALFEGGSPAFGVSDVFTSFFFRHLAEA